MALTFRAIVRRSGQVTILDLSGRVALADGSKDLSEKVREIVNEGHTQVLLNLAEVTYFDSSGLGELMTSFGTVKRAGGKMKLLNLPPRIADLFRMTKLENVFERFADEREAVASFNDGQAAAV